MGEVAGLAVGVAGPQVSEKSPNILKSPIVKITERAVWNKFNFSFLKQNSKQRRTYLSGTQKIYVPTQKN